MASITRYSTFKAVQDVFKELSQTIAMLIYLY